MTASLGSAALALAFATMLFAVAAALAGRNGNERWVVASRRAVYAACALLTLCVALIEIAFAGDDFSLNIVQQHSSIETPNFYELAAMWSSQEGSLLLWAWSSRSPPQWRCSRPATGCARSFPTRPL